MAPRAAGSLGRRKVPENALLAPSLSGQPLPELSAGQESALPQCKFLAAALGRIPLWLPSAFVHHLPLSTEGSTKWPPQPSAILCLRRAGGRTEGTTAPACPAWPGRSPAPPRPRPALARPPWTWHQPTSWQGGRERRPLSPPRPALAPPPAPAPSGRGCCRPEPRAAVIKAMLLGSLRPARTVLEKTLARRGVGCWTPCTGPGLSRAALGTKAAPSVLHSAPQLPWTCPRSSPLLVWARVPRVFRKQGQGASWRRWAAPGPAEVLLLLGSGAASAAKVRLVERQWPC